MSRVASRPAHPAPAAESTKPAPDLPPLPPYSYVRPFPLLPEQWRSEQAQAKLLNEYLTHDGFFGTFATQRGLTVDQLYNWLHSEEITARRKRLEEMSQQRAELLARLARPAAIQSLLHIINKGLMSDNQVRLAASAILRAAAAADRSAELRAKQPRSQEPTCPCATGQPALGLASAELPKRTAPGTEPPRDSSARVPSGHASPWVSAEPAAPQPSNRAHTVLVARASRNASTTRGSEAPPAVIPDSPRVLARIGPSHSARPPTRRPSRPKKRR